MTIEEYFERFPIEEPKTLTNEDLRKALNFAFDSTKMYNKNDNSLTKQEKIDSYKALGSKFFDENFNYLTNEAKEQLYEIFNQYRTATILEHLR